MSTLPPLSRRRLPVPLPSPWFWGLVVLYVLLGLVGHDPWKGDDAIGFGIAWNMANGTWGDWLLPNVAGQLVAEEGPLAFWLAALFIKALSGVLEAHDAARLATAVWTSIAIIAVHRAARRLDGEAAGRLAVLALLATLGLLARSHEIAAEPAFLAGWALVLWSLALGREFGFKGALLLAAGLAVCYLSRGMTPTRVVLLTILVTWLALRRGESWSGGFGGARDAVWKIGAFVAAHLLFLAWALSATANAAFHDLYRNWGEAQFGWPGASAWTWYAKTLPWFVFPAWPIALWWVLHRRPVKLLDVYPVPPVQHLPVAATLCVLASLAWSPQASEAVLLPIVVPLAILIAPGLKFLRRGFAALTDWFGRLAFTLAAALVWLGYVAMQTGTPPRIAANLARLEPGFVATLQWPALAIAIAATLAWCVAIARSERTPLRGIVHWCYGVTLVWLLLMTLFLPWVDYGRSYRGVAAGMQAAMGVSQGAVSAQSTRGCVNSRDLGLSERASFAYFARLKYGAPGAACPWLLVQGTRGQPTRSEPGYRLVWEGNRPGDRNERFRLYRRTP
ncbi:MAG: glycosyltransferase family 39 protein [Burkholderiales bacterium]|nr:glycosyltransferase family 39 protein [Burkholderiales bacterium]